MSLVFMCASYCARIVSQQINCGNLPKMDRLVHDPLATVWRLSLIQRFCANKISTMTLSLDSVTQKARGWLLHLQAGCCNKTLNC